MPGKTLLEGGGFTNGVRISNGCSVVEDSRWCRNGGWSAGKHLCREVTLRIISFFPRQYVKLCFEILKALCSEEVRPTTVSRANNFINLMIPC